ncbi:MAG TPA: MBL fold metallo-hydrolase [Anaerolineaceae bacterium]|nr:MBL fold metallo-hydrolase [Anaerolineaceae bacterium]
MEVLPNIHQFRIPIPDNPLGFINAYLITTRDGCLLIDTGWNTSQAFDSLQQQMADVGVTLADLRYIAITHVHPDHYGLVGRIEKYTNARLIIHEIERLLLYSRYVNYQPLLDDMDQWLEVNGVPTADRPALQLASMEILGLVEVAMPDQVVHGGEHLVLGDFDLEILWTPGHSPGHICLYDASRQVLFAGDHLLEKITPNVSMTSQSISNPLVDYLNSLHQVARCPVQTILPGHGKPFGNLVGRMEEIQQHHEHRMEEMLALFQGQTRTAYEIARATTWYTSWENLPYYSRRMAVTETLSHLELLLARGALLKTTRNGIIWYTPA